MSKYSVVVVSLLLVIAGFAFARGAAEGTGEEALSKIQWEKPIPMVDRITKQGPVEVIPAWYDDYGVKLSGRKGMLTGYILPDGWKEAIGDVKELVLTNSGGMKHDPATALNAKVFEKLTGIHLNLIEMKDPLLWPKSLAVVMAKSTDVDLFYATRAMLEIPHMSAAGWIMDMDVIWTEPTKKLFPPKQLRALKGVDGKMYGPPIVLWGQYLFYRKSWLEKAGVKVPDTWQELVTASKKVDDWARANLGPGNSGMVYPAGDPDPLHQIWAMTTYAQKKTIINEQGKVAVDKASWQLVTDLWTKGGMSKESMEYLWSAAPEVFAKGKGGFIITGGVYMNNFADPEFGTGIQNDWGVALVPKFEGFDAKGINLAGNDSFMINPYISPEKKAAAILWCDFLRSYQAQFNELYVEGNESSMISVYDHPAIKSQVSYPELRKATVAQQAGEAFPPGMMDVMQLYKEYLHRVILGQLGAEEARQKLQGEIDSIQ